MHHRKRSRKCQPRALPRLNLRKVWILDVVDLSRVDAGGAGDKIEAEDQRRKGKQPKKYRDHRSDAFFHTLDSHLSLLALRNRRARVRPRITDNSRIRWIGRCAYNNAMKSPVRAFHGKIPVVIVRG